MSGVTKPDVWSPTDSRVTNKVADNKKIDITYWLKDYRSGASEAEKLGAEMTKFGPFADMYLVVRAARKRIVRTGNGVEIKVQYGVNKRSLH